MHIFIGGMKPLFWGDTTTIVENKPLFCAIMTPLGVEPPQAFFLLPKRQMTHHNKGKHIEYFSKC